jgi:antitoxin ParD1/3/4
MMNVSLTPELEPLIHRKVESGLYLSASEVVREALRLLEEQDTLRALRFEEVRHEIQLGIEQADRGEVEPLDVTGTLAEVRRRRSSSRTQDR